MHVLKVSAFFAIMALSSGLAAGDESGLPPSQENVASEQAVPAGERALPFYDTAFVALVDGTTQHYVLVPPENVAGSEAIDVLIALHGHGSDRWQYIKDPRDECRVVRDAARKYGMLLVSPDYRASTSWMGPRAEADTVQIIEEVKRHYTVGKVFLCGGSMGGTACLTFAALHPGLVDGVASMNGTANLVEYDNFQEDIRESFGGGKEEVPDEYRKRSAEYFPERLTMPVGITAGGRDDVVPSASVVRLAKTLKAAGRDVLLLFRENGGHATNYSDGMAILEFILEKGGALNSNSGQACSSPPSPEEAIPGQNGKP